MQGGVGRRGGRTPAYRCRDGAAPARTKRSPRHDQLMVRRGASGPASSCRSVVVTAIAPAASTPTVGAVRVAVSSTRVPRRRGEPIGADVVGRSAGPERDDDRLGIERLEHAKRYIGDRLSVADRSGALVDALDGEFATPTPGCRERRPTSPARQGQRGAAPRARCAVRRRRARQRITARSWLADLLKQNLHRIARSRQSSCCPQNACRIADASAEASRPAARSPPTRSILSSR